MYFSDFKNDLNNNEIKLQFELVTFKNIFITKEEQYRAFQIIYQVGVFVSRSSVNIIQIRKTWIMSIIQGCIAIFFFFEAIYLFTPSILIIFAIIFIEGLQGGLAYVNTYYRMTQEVPQHYKAFAMNIVAMGDSFGIIAAGFLAIRVHNWICQLPVTTDI
jgi:battenin